MDLFLTFCILSFRSNTVLSPLFNPRFSYVFKSKPESVELFYSVNDENFGEDILLFNHTGFPKAASECRMMGS